MLVPAGFGPVAGILACALLLAGTAVVAKFSKNPLLDRLASSTLSAQAGQHTEDAARRRGAAVAQVLTMLHASASQCWPQALT
jgi:hypothetical protein